MINCKVVVLLLCISSALGKRKTHDKIIMNETADKEITTNICPDCRQYLIFCRIVQHGHIVQLSQDVNKIKKCDSKKDQNNSLAACVPNAYKIIGLLEGSACFWSPQLGCNLLMGKLQQEKGYSDTICLECLSRCPCANGSRLYMRRAYVAMCLGLILMSRMVF